MSTDTETRWSVGQVLEVGRFRAYLIVYVLDVASDALWLVNLGWVAAAAHNSVDTGLVLAAGAIPHLFFLFHGGLRADRMGSAHVLRRTMPVRLALLLIWAAVATAVIGSWRLLVVLAVTFAIGAVAGFHDPAMGKYPTEFLPRKGRGTAIRIERVSSRFAQGAGAFAGGWLLAHGGVSLPSLAGAALLLVTLAVLAKLARFADAAPAEMASSDATIGQGLGYVRSHPILRWTVTTQGFVNLVTAAAVMAMLPIKAHRAGWDVSAYGGSFGAYGLGITIGTAVTLQLHKLSTRASVLLGVGSAVVSSASVIGIGLATTQTQAVAYAFVMGLAIGPVAPMLSGFAREDSPEILAGRVMSVIAIATAGIEPVGSLATGALAAVLTIDQAAELLGALATLVCLVCFGGVWLATNKRVVVAGPDHV